MLKSSAIRMLPAGLKQIAIGFWKSSGPKPPRPNIRTGSPEGRRNISMDFLPALDTARKVPSAETAIPLLCDAFERVIAKRGLPVIPIVAYNSINIHYY